jgi:hypothetical protein
MRPCIQLCQQGYLRKKRRRKEHQQFGKNVGIFFLPCSNQTYQQKILYIHNRTNISTVVHKHRQSRESRLFTQYPGNRGGFNVSRLLLYPASRFSRRSFPFTKTVIRLSRAGNRLNPQCRLHIRAVHPFRVPTSHAFPVQTGRKIEDRLRLQAGLSRPDLRPRSPVNSP